MANADQINLSFRSICCLLTVLVRGWLLAGWLAEFWLSVCRGPSSVVSC